MTCMHASCQFIFRDLNTLTSGGWLSRVVCGGKQKIIALNSLAYVLYYRRFPKFQHPNYLTPLRVLIAIYSKVRQASQIFKAKLPYFLAACVCLMHAAAAICRVYVCT